MPEEAIRFSVVVPTYNRRAKLQRCLQALLSQQYPPARTEVIVVDDGGADGTEAMMKEYAGVRYVRLAANGGPARARNTGVAQARGEFIAFTDDDCIVPPDWLENFDKRLLADPALDVITGYQVAGEETLREFIGARYEHWLSRSVYGLGVPEGREQGVVRNAGTNNLCVRRKALLDAGGFSEAFSVAAGEDRDLLERLLARGCAIWRSNMTVTHCQEYEPSHMERQQVNRGRGYVQYRRLRGMPMTRWQVRRAQARAWLELPWNSVRQGPAMGLFTVRMQLAQKRGMLAELDALRHPAIHVPAISTARRLGEMKVLVVGAKAQFGSEEVQNLLDRGEAYRRAFALLGCATEIYYHRDRVRQAALPGARRLLSRAAARLEWTDAFDIHRRADHELLELARRFRPDVVFVVKGDTLRRSVLQQLRAETGARHVWNMFPDNPFLYDTVFEALDQYTAFFVKGSIFFAQLRNLGFAQAHYVSQCCEGIEYDLSSCSEEEKQRHRCDAVVVGSLYPQRVRILEQLQDFNVHVWGPPLRGALKHCAFLRTMHQGRELAGVERAKAYAFATVALNTHHPLNDLHGINIRNYEIAEARGLLLTNEQGDLSRFFEPGRECATYTDIADLRSKILYYKAHPEERAAIIERGHARVMREHTYNHRVREMAALCELEV